MSEESKDLKLTFIKQQFKQAIKNRDLTKCNKETLIKLIFLYESLSNRKFLEVLADLILDFQPKSEIEEKLLLVRLRSIVKAVEGRKYIRKTENPNFSEYEYEGYVDIFIKQNLSNFAIDAILVSMHKYKFLEFQL
jgi:hypothetical protein